MLVFIELKIKYKNNEPYDYLSHVIWYDDPLKTDVS